MYSVDQPLRPCCGEQLTGEKTMKTRRSKMLKSSGMLPTKGRMSVEMLERLTRDEETEKDCNGAQRLNRLEQTLLALGGSEVVVRGVGLYAGRLLERGQLFNQRAVRRRGEAHRCHRNAAGLWMQQP